MRKFAAIVALALTSSASAQEPAKPGPEHEALLKRAGTWETTMKAGGMEFKGSITYKSDLGGLWLSGAMESELFGQKFSGRSLETFDAGKKKYVSIWVDSMGTAPVLTEGAFDKAKKALTMEGEGPGMDGKPAKYRSVAEMPDDNTINFTMYIGDGKEPMFTVVYKRKK